MKLVDARAFLNARAKLDPDGLAGIPENHEARWLADDSPYSGHVNRLVFEDAAGVAARILVLQPSDSAEALFCFYGRRENLDAATRDSFFHALDEWLGARGITSLQGPIEFSTWNPYRFVCQRGSSPWFPGEQPMPDYHFTDFTRAGFSESARFVSSLIEDLQASIEMGLAMGVDQKLGALDIDTICGSDLFEIMPTLYELSSIIFKDNYAYSPITYDEFQALYADTAAYDAAVIVAKHDQIPLGLTFSYSIGPYAAVPGEAAKMTSVLKTIGVVPQARKLRIGYGVSYLTHKLWLERGCEQIIHACMKSDNASLKMSSQFGRRIREYALLQWTAIR